MRWARANGILFVNARTWATARSIHLAFERSRPLNTSLRTTQRTSHRTREPTTGSRARIAPLRSHRIPYCYTPRPLVLGRRSDRVFTLLQELLGKPSLHAIQSVPGFTGSVANPCTYWRHKDRIAAIGTPAYRLSNLALHKHIAVQPRSRVLALATRPRAL
jgi:hypothetical protein